MAAALPAWSVKGIDKATRELAKTTAHEKGITLGEWLEAIILKKEDVPAFMAEDTAEDLMGAEDIGTAGTIKKDPEDLIDIFAELQQGKRKPRRFGALLDDEAQSASMSPKLQKKFVDLQNRFDEYEINRHLVSDDQTKGILWPTLMIGIILTAVWLVVLALYFLQTG